MIKRKLQLVGEALNGQEELMNADGYHHVVCSCEISYSGRQESVSDSQQTLLTQFFATMAEQPASATAPAPVSAPLAACSRDPSSAPNSLGPPGPVHQHSPTPVVPMALCSKCREHIPLDTYTAHLQQCGKPPRTTYTSPSRKHHAPPMSFEEADDFDAQIAVYTDELEQKRLKTG